MGKLDSTRPFRAGTHTEFVSKENRCKHCGTNPKRHDVRQYQVDGGVFPKGDSPVRCDWLLLNDTEKRAYYIELKGSDIQKATEQIEETIQALSPELPGYTEYRRIIYHTGSHKIQDSRVIRWKRNHTNIIIKERELTELVHA